MTRGRLIFLPLVLVCLLGGACAGIQDVVGLSSTPAAPDPASSIAVSIPSDSIYLVDPTTGAEKSVASGLSDFQSGYAAWAPDHHHLAYGNGGIKILDTATGTTRVLVSGQLLSMPAWSQDGKQLAYGNGTTLWVTPVARANPVKLNLPENLAPLSMNWGRGGAIVFEGLQLDCNNPGPCLSTEQRDIWATQPNGTGLTQLTALGTAQNPRWSPDGQRILFIRTVTVKRASVLELWTVRSDGTGLRRVTRVTGMMAADWSPDGTSIAFVSKGKGPGLNTLELWVVGADGSDLHRVGGPISGANATIDW
jgi:Tol biopolymer transport system component